MNKRIIIGICLTILIVVGIGFVIKNKEEFFKNKASITYPDGCVEDYEDMVLIGDKCNTSDMAPNDKYNQYDIKTKPDFS